MYSTCLFCGRGLASNDEIPQLPIGRRLAFDPARGRLWVVCDRCGRWNLTPLEERWETVEECERRFRTTRCRVSTANVGLARLGSGLELVRIGEPLRPELAAWRYGDQFGLRRRRAIAWSGASTFVLVSLSALGIAGAGAAAITAAILLDMTGMLPLPAGWDRIVCRVPVGSQDFALVREADVAETRVLTGGPWHDRWGLQVSFGNGLAVLSGDEAVRVAGLLLARVNRLGASDDAVRRAVAILDRHGDAAHCFRFAAARPERERFRLARMPIEIRLALEMAAHEDTERRILEGDLVRYEAEWLDAEEIAAIADGLLLPAEVIARFAVLSRG